MTEVEPTKLLSDVSAVAEQLNEESDSLNDIFDVWEKKLRTLNTGLEAWETISSEAQPVEFEEQYVPGSVDLQLGWAKYRSDWQLWTRQLTYRRNPRDEWEEIEGRLVDPINSASREVRIEALEALPRLLQRLKVDAERAVEKIQRAKKLAR